MSQMSQTQSLGFYGMESSCSPTQDRVSHSQINITDYCHDLAKRLSHYLYFFSFLFFFFGLTTTRWSMGKYHVTLSNSEQRDSWLNSGHRTLDADNYSPCDT